SLEVNQSAPATKDVIEISLPRYSLGVIFAWNTMPNQRDISQDKTVGDLAREAALFLTHTLVAVILLAIAIGSMSLNHPDPDSTTPKLLGTVLALLVPMI